MSAEDRLRELAQAATPGPWICYGDHLVWPSDNGPAANDPIAAIGEAHDDCAAYIAAASPDVVLGLLDRLAAAEAERDRLAAAVERVARVMEWRLTYYHEGERTGQNTFNTDAATDAARALDAYKEECRDGHLAALHCRINGGEWMAVMPSVVVNRAALDGADDA